MYVKLFRSIYQGTLRGNAHGLLVFTNLLANADSVGCVDVHPRAIAEETGLAEVFVRTALDGLESPDPESRSPEEDGRRIVRLNDHRAWGWRIVNYGKYREIKNAEDRREQNRLAQERWREKNKQSSASRKQRNHESSQSAHAEAEAEAKKEKEPRKRATLPGCPDGVAERVWADWLALRKAKRAPVNQTVIEAAMEEAGKAGLTLEAFLREWCSRGSQGLKAEWLKPQGKGGGEPQWAKDRKAAVAAYGGAPRQTGEIIDMEAINAARPTLG